jgi:zinc/manganese transport system permease protein
MNLDLIEWSIIGPAFVAGLLVIATHVPLGQEVLRRGIVFLDLAVAQLAGLGVIAVHVIWHDEPGLGITQLVALSVACIGALLMKQTEHLPTNIQEALIGVVFVLASSLGLLLLANDPHGGEQLKELLVGQILWVELSELWLVALAYVLVLGLWFTQRRQRSGIMFYLLFGFTITISVQLVGIYLVFASLIIPALVTTGMQNPRGLVTGYGVSILGYGLGLVLSALLDLPSGAMIVMTLVAAGLLIRPLLRQRSE